MNARRLFLAILTCAFLLGLYPYIVMICLGYFLPIELEPDQKKLTIVGCAVDSAFWLAAYPSKLRALLGLKPDIWEILKQPGASSEGTLYSYFFLSNGFMWRDLTWSVLCWVCPASCFGWPLLKRRHPAPPKRQER